MHPSDVAGIWQPGGEWGSPIRIVSKTVETGSGGWLPAYDDRQCNPLAPLTIKGECFRSPSVDSTTWEHAGGGKFVIWFDRQHRMPRRYGNVLSVGYYANGGWDDDFEIPEGDRLSAEEAYWSLVQVNAQAPSCFPGRDMHDLRAELMQPGTCLEAIIACRAGRMPPLGVIEGGRILALRLAPMPPASPRKGVICFDRDR